MNSIARRLLGAAAAAVARKLLPDAVPENPGSALALRPPIGELMPPADRRSEGNLVPTVRPSQTLYAPPPSPPPQIYYAPPPAPPRRRRKKVTVTETYTHWRS